MRSPVRPLIAGLAGWALASSALAADAAHPVVVELFTSQGCSSCPPANDNLAKLARRPDVLALSFAVTYWDKLGWKDTFASPAYTARQYAYAKRLPHAQVATPQMVVNGRLDVIGNRLPLVDAALKKAERAAGPEVSFAPGLVKVAAAPAPKGGAEVWLVRYEPKIISVPVRAGENTGKTLPHTNVVRQLTRLGAWTGAAKDYALPAGKPGLAQAVIVQRPNAGPVIAAAKG